MTVYVIRRNGDKSGLVKVGYTNNLPQRLASMMTSAPEGFEVIHALDGGRDLEKSLHSRFAQKRESREWFSLTAEELSIIPTIKSVLEREYREQHIPKDADEFSDNIIHEARFYLNELVKREWRGFGDSVQDVIDRVMADCRLDSSYGFRLWQKYQTLKDVSGEAYRNLRLAYAMKLVVEGSLNDNQDQFLKGLARTYRNNPELQSIDAFGVSYVIGLINHYFPTDQKPTPAGVGMASPKAGKARPKKA